MNMKVSNILQNAVTNAVQNLHHSVENVRERPEVTKVKNDQPVVKTAVQEQQAENSSEARINIPPNFKPLVGLTAREQAFFENLFPKSRKEIQAYTDQREKVNHEKGKLIDVKG